MDSTVGLLLFFLDTIYRFGICKIASSLVTQKSIFGSFSQLFGDMCRAVKNLSPLILTFVAEIAGDTLPSCFSSHTTRVSFPCSVYYHVLHIFVLLLILLRKMALKEKALMWEEMHVLG